VLKLKFVWPLAAVAAVAAGLLIWWAHERPAGEQPARSEAARAAATQGAAGYAAGDTTVGSFNWAMPAGTSSTVSAPLGAPRPPLDGMAPSHFHADSAGKLVSNSSTRNELERLVALNTPQEARAQLQQLAKTLPPAAARELNDLYAHYTQYSTALVQAFPPGVAPANEAEALKQLDGLHALRVEHFGAETADALYGAEEKTARQLIELMRAQNDPKLTLEQKAQLAQEAMSKHPPLSTGKSGPR
jgi:lipase chaperone LimK